MYGLPAELCLVYQALKRRYICVNVGVHLGVHVGVHVGLHDITKPDITASQNGLHVNVHNSVTVQFGQVMSG